MEPDDITDLRERLVAMRGRLVDSLAQKISGGDLALLGSVAGAIAALDQMRTEIAHHG
jgi:hypothetical protein